MTTRSTVDILLAVYNSERFLQPFLESLAAQSFCDFRLVVSDNFSSDGTIEILRQYSRRLANEVVILRPPEKLSTACANFAHATRAADAPYVMYADADDVWHENKIEWTLAAMMDAERKFGSTAAILVHTDLSVVDQDLHCVSPSFWRYQFIDPDRTKLNHLLMQNCVTGCTIMLNRPLLDLGRPVPGDASIHDHWFALVASAFGHIVKIGKPLIKYRQHDANAIGAQKWGAGYILRRALRLYAMTGAQENIDLNVRQAGAFLRRFDVRLNPAQKRLVESFATIRDQTAWQRRWRLIRFGLWKTGFARNLGLLLAI